LISLFLTWSHQPSRLAGVPRDATAWQLYTYADVLLALLAAAVVVAAHASRRARLLTAAAVAIALAFVAHALAAPPSNVGVPHVHATAGPGETLALVGLTITLAVLCSGRLVARRHQT